jgi:hypothetical protein
MSNVYNYLNYERLTDITKKNKPYRKSTDRFPLSYRQHGYKCFFVKQDENGDTEYHIAYQYRWDEVEITRDWDIIGVVRKDNTFEFMTDRLHQGTRHFISQMFNVYRSEVVSSIKHGGAIYREYERDEEKNRTLPREYGSFYKDTKVVPLFQGQRIDLATNTSTLNYEVHLPYVNRKRSKDAMAKYKDDLNVAEMFFKTMTQEVFRSELREVFAEVYPDEKPNWRNQEAADKLLMFTKAQVGVDIYKAMYAVMMYKGTLNAWSVGSNNSYYLNLSYDPLDYFKSAKSTFVKQLKLENNVHDIKVYKANEAYPSNTWEVKVFVDGKQVRVY